jgi:ribosomal protein S14
MLMNITHLSLNNFMEELEKELKKLELERSKEKGKCFGECESCGVETVLVQEVGLCGPCCFGEAETINGNW